MLRSLFSAISGLQAHQTKMDVVGNNIANVNTVGFKSSTTVFEDTLSQLLRNGAAPTADAAGTNPAQVGLGVKMAAISTNFQQGSTQSTGRSTDFMINGDGFFVTKVGQQQFYTRAGSFDVDGNGRLHTPDGAILQGWTADANGVINTNGTIDGLRIPFGQVLAPQQTSAGSVAGNLDATATVTTPVTSVQTQVPMYDAAGNAHQMTYLFTRQAAGWDFNILDPSGTSVTGGPQALTFNAAGTLTTPTTVTFTPPAAFPSWSGTVTVDLTEITSYGSPTGVTAGKPVTGAGSAMGTLQSFTLGEDGVITGSYSNGLKQSIGRLALATFANPGGLMKAGNSSFQESTNSGLAAVGTAGTNGRGFLQSGALEMSNVDLAQEFTGLIIAQRGFQANSKVITTSDQILQDLVQMKG